MADDQWQEMSLGDFVTLQRGHDLPDQERRPGKVPILGSFGITGYHDSAKAKGPGVTVGRSGASFGVVSYTPVEYWPLNTALYVTDFHGNHERFAYYFLKTIDFKRYNSGSAQPSLNRNYIHPIPVKIPALAEQRAIAHILGTLDDKIELNRRINATLEAMARAIFKSWFVDFDPVRAKAEGRDTGLPKAVADLFADTFEDGEVERVPKGWKVVALGTQVEAQKGLSYKGSGLAVDGVPMHNLNSVYEGGGYKFEGIKFYAGDYEERHIIEPGDLIVTNTVTVHSPEAIFL
jgi:type I restriction enzyme S subunit